MQRLTFRENGKAFSIFLRTAVVDKLADYEDAEENGMLIHLPCRIGDKVYRIVEDKFESTMKTIEFEGHEYHRHIPHYFISACGFAVSMLDDFGKTVFLTKQEAEQVVEAMREDGDSA